MLLSRVGLRLSFTFDPQQSLSLTRLMNVAIAIIIGVNADKIIFTMINVVFSSVIIYNDFENKQSHHLYHLLDLSPDHIPNIERQAKKI